jgi:thiol-disulfide isomerase/thioredoxin
MNYFGKIGGGKEKVKKDFKKECDKKNISFVLFFMNGCGPCKGLHPEWQKFAKNNKRDDLQMISIESADIDKSFGIDEFPTMKIYENGTPKDYTGERTAKGMMESVGSCDSCGKEKKKKA